MHRRRDEGTGLPSASPTRRRSRKLESFPAWTPGAGDGNYFIGPEYAPAPELTPKDGVPKGRVETFTLTAADSKFYPDTGLRGATPTRAVTVYIPSQYVAGTAAPLIVVLRRLRGAQQPAADDSRQHDRGATGCRRSSR